jgi:hypothetical protein
MQTLYVGLVFSLMIILPVAVALLRDHGDDKFRHLRPSGNKNL